MNVREVLEFAKKHRVQMVDLKFVDLPGVWLSTRSWSRLRAREKASLWSFRTC